MTVLVAVLVVLSLAGVAVGAWRLFRRDRQIITPDVLAGAEKRAGAIAAARESEARARTGLSATAEALAIADAKGKASPDKTAEAVGFKVRR